MAKTRIKPVFLNADKLRSRIASTSIGNDLLPVHNTVASLSSLYDALTALHDTPDPSISKEAKALKYKRQHGKALEHAQKQIISTAERLDDLERRIRSEAEAKAGLHAPLTEAAAQEIRAAMRSMKQSERDKLARDAALNGDASILQAIRGAASPVLYGGITEPVDALIDMHVNKMNPDIAEKLDALEEATRSLSLASDAFAKETDKLRSPKLEWEAELQEQTTQSAEAALLAAMGSES